MAAPGQPEIMASLAFITLKKMLVELLETTAIRHHLIEQFLRDMFWTEIVRKARVAF